MRDLREDPALTLDARIRADVEARIRSGAWRPGDRIPFEHQLQADYACSRATVSKALTTLARAGLIERRRKAGSFVAHPPVHSAVLAVPDLAAIVAQRGESYAWRLERCSTVASDNAISVEGVHLSGGEPLALERRLISLAAVPDAADESFAAVAPGTWLLEHVAWTRATHRIQAVEATVPQARRLGSKRGAACLAIERATWRGDAWVTRVTQLFRGDRFDLVAEFQPGA